ncbi:MAG: hypothetical protein LJE68_05830 [Rhodobacter sp.]|jgi:hypothetical protein|nr:hypothetical protein [Rhodobacter sp.]
MKRIALIAAAVLGLTMSAHTASAICLAQPENGNWRNIDSNTRSITRATIRFQCQDQILNGRPYPPGAPWYIHLWGSCSPSDCDWGEVPARRLENGWIFGRIDQGFARRELWVKMSGGRLRVYVRTDFTDPNRADYNTDNFFTMY